MAGKEIGRTGIRPDWIDYNGHLRDAYYVVILSDMTDRFMDQIGVDASYRERTKCTLYTLEMHLHYLLEVKESDELRTDIRLIAHDQKRIHASLEMYVPRHATPVLTAECMLLHVHQGETVGSAPFPPEVMAHLSTWQQASDAMAPTEPASRPIGLRKR
jgi:acyl-CoA thioester hydrolase